VLTVVLWRWGKKYQGVKHLQKMRSMLKSHLSVPHRIVVLTDNQRVPNGMDRYPVPRDISSASKCMRRMWIFSDEAKVLGKRLLQLDIDLVLTDSIDAIANRTEDFVIWKGDSNWKGWCYNPSVMLITPGAKADVWKRWKANPKGVYRQAHKDGWAPKINSDQAIASYLMKDQDIATYTQADGIFAYRVFAGKHGQRGQHLPEGCRIVSFHGPRDPSHTNLQKASPWLEDHWR
jgi:hypothetical protein